MLWIAAGLAFFAEWSQAGTAMGMLGTAILAVIGLNGSFSYWQQRRAERAIDALERLLPARARVLRDGELCEIEARAIVPGDALLLAEGDLVPADGRIVECVALRVNRATLTGESAPVSLEARDSTDPDLAACWAAPTPERRGARSTEPCE